MTRNLKVLGLAMMAMLAMSAVAASASQAAAPEFHCTSTAATCTVKSSGGTKGTGSNDNEFKVKVGTVKCTGNASVDGAQFSATIAKTTAAATGVSAVYSGCKLAGVAATVAMNGCTYSFNAVAGSNPATATVDVVCPEGKSISVAAPAAECTITVGSQKGLNHVVFTNAGSEPTHVAANITVEGIKYTQTGANCENGTFTDGKYNGTVTLTGFEGATKVGLHVF